MPQPELLSASMIQKSALLRLLFELILNISVYLTQSELFACLMVSRLFYHVLKPQLYLSIETSSRFGIDVINSKFPITMFHGTRRLLISPKTYLSIDLFRNTLPHMKSLQILEIDSSIIEPKIVMAIYKLMPSKIQSLRIAYRPEYFRDRQRFIIPFAFIGTGHPFDISRINIPLPFLSTLDVPELLNLDSHPELSTCLSVLILNMPLFTKSLVMAIFNLKHLKKLRIIEPKSIEPWDIPSDNCLWVPKFTGLTDFHFGGESGVWPIKSAYYFQTRNSQTLPLGLVELIVASNPNIARLSILQITDNIIKSLIAHSAIEELRIACSVGYTGQITYSPWMLGDFLEQPSTKHKLRCLFLPISVGFLSTTDIDWNARLIQILQDLRVICKVEERYGRILRSYQLHGGSTLTRVRRTLQTLRSSVFAKFIPVTNDSLQLISTGREVTLVMPMAIDELICQ